MPHAAARHGNTEVLETGSQYRHENFSPRRTLESSIDDASRRRKATGKHCPCRYFSFLSGGRYLNDY